MHTIRYVFMSTRDKILQESFNLFLQRNYKEVSLKDIVEKVGLTKGAFYHHFKSKEQLFIEVLDEFILNRISDIYDTIPKNSLKLFIMTYLDRIISYIDKYKHNTDSIHGQRGFSLYHMFFDALRILPEFEIQMQQMHLKEREAWIKVIANARKSNEIKSHLSDVQLARLFISINDGISSSLVLENRLDDIPGEIYTHWMGFYNLIKY